MRYRALLTYDGTDNQGFQWQPRGTTIQGEVERALAEVTRQKVRVVGAGRTDAGVHAVGQVIAFDVEWWHAVAELQRAANALLPADIVVRCLERAPDDFHPRYDARSRVYRYTVLNQRWRAPLLSRFTCHVPQSLDVTAMDCAARTLVGVHDFGAFGQPPKPDGPTIREVLAARCWRESISGWGTRYPLVHFEIEANAFLRRMVRQLMGTLLWVGQGRCSVGDFADLVGGEAERRVGPSAPARGLCLQSVVYDWVWGEQP